MGQTLQQVILNGKTLWLAADVGERDGALCSEPEDYEHGRPSYAHLSPDGRISRFGAKIGEFDDLEFTGLCHNSEVADDGWFNILTDEGWKRR